MKFIAFWEHHLEDTEKVIEKRGKLRVEIEKFHEKYPKTLSSYHMGYCNSFTVYEADNNEQLMNLQLHYFPDLRFEFIPILETSKTIELIVKMKK